MEYHPSLSDSVNIWQRILLVMTLFSWEATFEIRTGILIQPALEQDWTRARKKERLHKYIFFCFTDNRIEIRN